jgi:predicted N-acetyltransferase YhbS
MIEITLEQPHDAAMIECLLDQAFGPHRINKISYRYRRGVEALHPLCLVARDDGAFVGTIRNWPIAIEDSEVPTILVGPVAVDPARAGCGIGAQLMNEAMKRARVAGYRLAVLVGDEPYYGRFGFAPVQHWGLVMPDEVAARVLGLLLDPALAVPRGRLIAYGSAGIQALPAGVISPRASRSSA